MFWKIFFLDISYWQGDVDFQALYDLGYRYILIRCTSGGTYQDPRFHEYYDKATAAGFVVSVYYVINPMYSAEVHWKNFSEHLGDRKVLVVTPDVQLTGGMSATMIEQRVRETIQLFDNRLNGRRGFAEQIVYTASWFWDRWIGFVKWALDYKLHMAQYPWLSPPDELPDTYRPTVIPEPWKSGSDEQFVVLQWTDKGYLPAVTSANVDKNAGTRTMYDIVFADIPTPPPPMDLEERIDQLEERLTVLETAFGQLAMDFQAVEERVNLNVDALTDHGKRIENLEAGSSEPPTPVPPPPTIDTMTMMVHNTDYALAWELTSSDPMIIQTNAFNKYGRGENLRWKNGNTLQVLPPPAITANGDDKFFQLPFESPEGKPLYVKKREVVQI